MAYEIQVRYYWKSLANGLLLDPEGSGHYNENINGYNGFETREEAIEALKEEEGACYVLVEEFHNQYVLD